MRAGYAQRPITPQIGCPLAGYGIYLGRTSRDVLDDLMVRAVVVAEGDVRIAICGYDLVGFSIEHCDRLRAEIATALGTSPAHVMLSFTHTHSGPPTLFLRGMGEVDEEYLAVVDRATLGAVTEAADDLSGCEAYTVAERVEPIGFNRVTGNLCPLDSTLALLCFLRDTSNIHLLGYACHAVTLGVNHSISADYPGRVCRALEDRGEHGLFIQGFCGDVDPISNQTHWGAGTETEIDYYGHHLVTRMDRIRRYARRAGSRISAGESRICLDYDAPLDGDLRAHEEIIRTTYPRERHPGVDRFAAEWREDAEGVLATSPHPVLDGVPVQILRVGETEILGLPGEVFCELGLGLRERSPLLIPAGYTNGNIGYIPTRGAYSREGDYACYAAPRFYGVFPFSPTTEERFLEATKQLVEEA